MRAGSVHDSPRTGPPPDTRSYRAGTSPVDAAEAALPKHPVQRLLDLSVLDRLAQRRLDRLGVGLRVEQPADSLDHVSVQVVGLLPDRRFHARASIRTIHINDQEYTDEARTSHCAPRSPCTGRSPSARRNTTCSGPRSSPTCVASSAPTASSTAPRRSSSTSAT